MLHLFHRQAGMLARRRQLALKAGLEGLEVRECLSTTVNLVGNTLNIIGDAAANDVNVVIRDNANDVKVVADGQTFHFASTQVKAMNLDMKGGDDHVYMQLGADNDAAAPMFDPKTIVAKMGDGDDSAQFWFGGLGLPGRVISTNLNITVEGGAGKDEAIGNFGELHSGTLNFNALMGAGDDSAFAGQWGTVDPGASLNFNLQGQDGNDTLNSFETYNGGYDKVDVAAGATFNINMNGGAGNDHMSMTYGGKVAGKLIARMDGGAGNDVIRGDFYVQSPSPGAVDAILMGGDGRDGLTLNMNGKPNALRALIDGGGGFDTAKGTSNVVIINANELVVPTVPGGVISKA